MTEILNNFIKKKVEEILSTPAYQTLSTDKKEELRKKIETHLKTLILESFVNRINDREAKEIKNLMEDNPQKAYRKISELSFKNEALREDLEPRLNREVQRFKSLKS